MENRKSHRQSHRKKVLPEIYLTRLLSTKVNTRLFVYTTMRLRLQLNIWVIFLFLVFMAYISLRSHLEIPTSHETMSLPMYEPPFFFFLHRELFRSSWMTSFKPSSASLRTAPLWLSNTSLTSLRSRQTNGASQTQTPCTSGKPTGRRLNSVIKVPFGRLTVQSARL